MVLADYNDKNYDYTKYWDGRDYENASEFIALEKLLPNVYDQSKKVIDVGGGFGRLLPIFKKRFGVIYIFDYSKKLLETAEENAEKLGINSKSISRWENGNNMPDVSLYKPLCDELNITINELLSGKKLSEKEYQEKLEENIVNTIDYSNKKINKNRWWT